MHCPLQCGNVPKDIQRGSAQEDLHCPIPTTARHCTEGLHCPRPLTVRRCAKRITLPTARKHGVLYSRSPHSPLPTVGQ